MKIKGLHLGLSLMLVLSCTSALAYPTKKVSSLIEARSYISNLGLEVSPYLALVSIEKQTLTLYHKGKVQKNYTISTSSKGPGQIINTLKTPLGLHVINQKIGDSVPPYGIFKARQYTGKKWSKPFFSGNRKNDYIITRILRLDGLEPWLNKGRDNQGRLVDTLSRHVYIHGTTQEAKLGKPISIGCVYLSSDDVLDLFNRVPVGTQVLISS